MIDEPPTLWDMLEGEGLLWHFIELPEFSEWRDHYFGGDEEFKTLQAHLASHPDGAPAMKGCGGLRKLRWGDPRRGKGRRGGLRIIYMQVPEVSTILLIDVYDKDEADDLTASERKSAAAAAKSLREACLRAGGTKGSGAG